MRVALTTSATYPSALESRVVCPQSRRCTAHHSCSLLLESGRRHLLPPTSRRHHSTTCTIKAQRTEHFGEPNNVSSRLNTLAGSLWDIRPEPLKEFPWKKASSMFVERLLYFGQKAGKWSLIALFAISFAVDISLAISTNRELMIPLGLFIGVSLADFLKEYSQEFFQISTKDEDLGRYLMGIGLFFVFVKLMISCFKKQGWVLLTHIGNGGLLQVFWLAKVLWQT